MIRPLCTLLVTFFLGLNLHAEDAVIRPWDPAEKWEGAIAAFETEDQETHSEHHPILFIGSSSIKGWELDDSWPGLHTLNRGFGGSTIWDSVHFFDRIVLPYQPKAIVMYAGDNDIAKGLSVDQVVADFLTFAGVVKEKIPGTPVIFIAIKPSSKRWDMWPDMAATNQKIAAICAETPGLMYADIATPMLKDTGDGPPSEDWFKEDGLHLNPEGYARWTAVLDPLLERAGVK